MQAIQRFVEFVKGDFGYRGDSDVVFNREYLSISAAFLGALVTSMVDQNAPHELGGDAEEVGSALPVDARLIYQLHVCFVDQSGSLQGMIAAFAAHIVGGDAAQFRIND